jgi:hypothetical protein
MRKQLATLAFVSIAALLLAVWFSARSSDDAVAVPRPNSPLSSTPAPAIDQPQPDAPPNDAQSAPRVEVEASAVAPQAALSAAPVKPSTLAEVRAGEDVTADIATTGPTTRGASWW